MGTPFPNWIKREVWCLNEKFFDGEAGHVSSTILAVAHEWAGISTAPLSRLSSSQPVKSRRPLL